VKRLACEGSVHGADDHALSKTVPCLAIRSRFGVVGRA